MSTDLPEIVDAFADASAPLPCKMVVGVLVGWPVEVAPERIAEGETVGFLDG